MVSGAVQERLDFTPLASHVGDPSHVPARERESPRCHSGVFGATHRDFRVVVVVNAKHHPRGPPDVLCPNSTPSKSQCCQRSPSRAAAPQTSLLHRGGAGCHEHAALGPHPTVWPANRLTLCREVHLCSKAHTRWLCVHLRVRSQRLQGPQVASLSK